MNELSINELKQLLENKKSAFISGNGLSMNFDNSFCDIYSDLFKAHKKVIFQTEYDVKANKAFKNKLTTNYKSVLQHLRLIDERQLNLLFEDGILFGKSILENDALYEELKRKSYFNVLKFGLSQWDILKQIYDIGEKKGFSYVNIEHWSILIYFYAAITRIKPKYYEMPKSNSFVIAIDRGNKHPGRLIGNDQNNYLLEFVLFNGFFTYYRMLFSTAIFSDGKAIDVNKLNRKDDISIHSVRDFLNSFDELFTLNFDHIIEGITGRDVVHIHGSFVVDKKEYVYSQSFNLKYDNRNISFSDILIGDYYMAKGYLPEVNRLSVSQNPLNKQLISPYNKLANGLKESKIEVILIFGMSIENDYHLLRFLILIFHELEEKNPHLIYSYFSDKEKREFQERYYKLITFSDEVNEYAKNIKISFIKTQDILSEYFKE
ncbi:hypothetical protein ACTHP3_00920 [Shouchella rhizosphaerae]|uniref:hypothetical protein n=1 Tax=Shouchella rhizosphaerae TaxID=866786 RepID=UPI003F7E3D1D